MPTLTTLAIAESDERVAEALRYGFEREGVSVELTSDASSVAARGEDLQVLVVGSRVNGASGAEFLTKLGGAEGSGAPVLYIGNRTERADAMAAGASQFLGRPAYVRDAVTACRLLAGLRRSGNPPALAGELGDHRGLYYLVRAVCALSFTGVLTLVRGLRRGEMRFFAGEVTSAALGLLHGQAALHQLMLWTEARIELRAEDVVRRHQIPKSPDEILHDVRRFLLEMRTIAPWLSPSALYRRVAQGEQLPIEVEPVLQLFDGQRTVADAIEDSPFRVFETLRITARLVELGVLERQPREDEGPPSDAMTLDEWLVGPPEAVAAEGDAKQRHEWESILPSSDGAAEAYASVVPSESTGGEIDMPGVEPRPPRADTADTRPLPKLEQLAAEEGIDGHDEGTTTEGAFETAGDTEPDGPRAADDDPSGPTDESDSEVLKEPTEEQRAALTDAAGAIAEGAKAASRAAQRAASEPGVSDRDHGEAAGEIEIASQPAAAETDPERAVVVDGGSQAPKLRRRRPATDSALAEDAGRVAAGAAQTARAAAAAFTAAEEAFFAAGDEIATKRPEPVDTFDDLEDVSEQVPPRGLGRWFRKKK